MKSMLKKECLAAKGARTEEQGDQVMVEASAGLAGRGRMWWLSWLSLPGCGEAEVPARLLQCAPNTKAMAHAECSAA